MASGGLSLVSLVVLSLEELRLPWYSSKNEDHGL